MDLLSKTEAEVFDQCCDIFRDTPGPMILGTSCLVAPRTPKENINAMVRASMAMAGQK